MADIQSQKIVPGIKTPHSEELNISFAMERPDDLHSERSELDTENELEPPISHSDTPEPKEPSNEAYSTRRNWLKDVGITAGVLGAGYATSYFLRDKEEPIAKETVTIETNEIVVPNEAFFERFKSGGDLFPVAYQFIESGMISYRFPIKPTMMQLKDQSSFVVSFCIR